MGGPSQDALANTGASQPNGPFMNGQQQQHQGFSGPSSGHHDARRQSVNILGDTDPMDVDRPTSSTGYAPTTAAMLEKARAASQRAESGPSPSSSTHPHDSYPPPSSTSANAHV